MSGRSEFLAWLDGWWAGLPGYSLARDLRPEDAGVLVVDLLNGFCREGPLASPRVGSLASPAAEFLARLWGLGVRRFGVAADAHEPDSLEFRVFPPHCIRGTAEAEDVAELAALPFWPAVSRFGKHSLTVGLEPAFEAWLSAAPVVRTWFVIGDCTDLCVYQAAMHLRLRANRRGEDVDVVVPVDLVDTYDLDVETAAALGAYPHDAELLHRLFCYHMALNGIRLVRLEQD